MAIKDDHIAPEDAKRQDEQEIDLLELFRKLWRGRRLLLKFICVGAVLGLIVGFSIPKEYTTTIELAPEFVDPNQNSRLGALASMAGLSGSTATLEAVQPEFYPDIVSSVPFAVSLFEVPVHDQDNEITTTVRGFLEDETSAPWWKVIIGLPGKAVNGILSIFKDKKADDGNSGVNVFHLTKEENSIVKALEQRVVADVDVKTSIITISVTMQDPVVSALLADTVAERLKEYVTDYRTNKAREDLEYARTLNEEAKADYYKAQQRYADYMDKNQGIVLRSARTEQERLQNEAALAFNLYNTTAQRLQAAKAKVQETTPVYTVLQPATVPLIPSKPSKLIILLGFMVLAALLGSAWILFGRKLVDELKSDGHRSEKDER